MAKRGKRKRRPQAPTPSVVKGIERGDLDVQRADDAPSIERAIERTDRAARHHRGAAQLHRAKALDSLRGARLENDALRQIWDLFQGPGDPIPVYRGDRQLKSFEELRQWNATDPEGCADALEGQCAAVTLRLKNQEVDLTEQLTDLRAIQLAQQQLKRADVEITTETLASALDWPTSRVQDALREYEETTRQTSARELFDSLSTEDPPGVTSRAASSVDFNAGKDGLLWIPTQTLRTFSKIAREQGLPGALEEEVFDRLARPVRHMVASSTLAEVDGRHYAEVEIQLTVLDPEQGFIGSSIDPEAILDTLLADAYENRDDRTKLARELIEEGQVIERDGTFVPANEAEKRGLVEQVVELQLERLHMKAEQRTIALPLRQFGLLCESRYLRAAEGERGENMPAHAGARSFETIWRRASHFSRKAHEGADQLRLAGLRVAGEEIKGDDAAQGFDVVDAEDVAQQVFGNAILGELRTAHVITVDIDVAEGLPDWESQEECFAYARGIELPFDRIFLDFTTPGGWCPLIEYHPRTEGATPPITTTLRAAIIGRDSNNDAIVIPFTSIRPDNWTPADIERSKTQFNRSTDFDPHSIVRFQRHPGNEILHRVLTGPGQIASPTGIVPGRRLGFPDGFAEVPTNAVTQDLDVWLAAHALFGFLAAARALSVLHALESTVNIELDDAHVPRPERRRLQRAAAKGDDVRIASTIHIRRTRTSEVRNEAPHKRIYSHAHWRRGTYAHYPLGTRIADALADEAPEKLVEHPVKGTCRRVYRSPTIIGRYDEDGNEREPVAKSYVWKQQQ